MTRYLVTGGCGFIGSHLVERLLSEGHEVRVLDNLSSGKRENVPSQIDFHRGDVADPATVKMAMENVDACFHLAAIASVERCNLDWLGSHAVNLGGSINVLHEAGLRDAPCPVIYASSAAVYGDCDALPLREDAPTRPLSPYGADKKASEDQAFAAAAVRQVPSAGMRFFNVYGPRQDPGSPYSGVIAKFAGRMVADQPITLFGDGSQTRDFIHVLDVVEALAGTMAALETKQLTGASVFNVCTGDTISILNLANIIAGIVGTDPKIKREPAQVGDISQSLGDPALLREATGFSAKHSLQEGLTDLLKNAPGTS